MSTDKTLADVQPGGMVRLATVPYDRARDLIGDAYNAGTHGIGYSRQAMELHDAIIPAQASKPSSLDLEAMLATCVPGGSIVDPQVVADNIRHWFAAQPSPGGQGDALCSELLARADCLDSGAAGDREAGESIQQAIESGEGYTPDDATDVAFGLMHSADSAEDTAVLLRKAAAALAARQPVGQAFHVNAVEPCGKILYVHPAGVKVGDTLYAAPPAQAADSQPVGEPVAWPNECSRTVPEALRFLANHARPSGGEDRFNSLHLMQLAAEIERMASKPLYTAPPAQAVDLGQFRELAQKWADKADFAPSPMTARSCSQQLLALIDSQAVGK